jgi:hypothetical protein
MLRYACLLAVLVLAGGCAGDDADASIDVSSNAALIAELHKAGVDLSQPRPVEFYTYFANAAAAHRVETVLRQRGYAVAFEAIPDDGEYGVTATKKILVDEASLAPIEAELATVAKAEGGDYDGFEVAVE